MEVTPTLTREQIEKMEAGPEMDALVAERVFGWAGWKRAEGDCLHGIPPDATGRDRHGTCVPNYSTHIAAAWIVVDKLARLSFGIDREQCFGVRYDVRCYDDPDMRDKVRATAETAPLAICRAALLATL